MRSPLIIRLQGSTNAATPTLIQAEIIKPGEMWLLLGIAAVNQSGEAVTAVFGIVTIDGFLPIGASASVADGDTTSGTAWMVIREGERLAVQLTGTAKTGKATLIASGVIFSGEQDVTVIIEQKA